jgi:hypothetical protein
MDVHVGGFENNELQFSQNAKSGREIILRVAPVKTDGVEVFQSFKGWEHE